jgi:ketosteroid isomerase-like protein
MILKMRLLRFLSILVPLACLVAQSPDSPISAALTEQTAAWNNADLPRFVATYAEHCTLVGKDITQVTRAEVLSHYRHNYPSAARMGHLTFSALQVTMLDERNAIAVGHWHLDRDSASGGPTGGVFSLVFQKEHGVWGIILDHTS